MPHSKKKKKKDEYYFLLTSKRSWANVFYPLLEKYIKKNNTEGILGYTFEPFHNGHLSLGTEESGRCREVQVIKS